MTEKVNEINERPIWIDAKEAAKYCNMSYGNLAKHRIHETGPAYRKIGARIIYDKADLDAWLMSFEKVAS